MSCSCPYFVRVSLLAFLMAIMALATTAQSNSASGIIRDAQGHPIAGVKVSVRESSTEATSNLNGEFSIAVGNKFPAHIEFIGRGYLPLTETIESATAQLNIVLSASPLLRQEVHVTAPRLEVPLSESPAAASVVTAETLTAMPRTVAAEEALASVPGMKIDNQANQERVHISIRGQGILTERGVRGIGVLLDGLPLNDPSGFAPDLFDVNWAAVQEVHVVRGPVAFLYGGASSGGVIDIATIAPSDQSHGTVDLLGGSNTFYKGHGDYSGAIGPATTYLSIARAEGAGYRVHTRFYGNNLYGKAAFQPNSRLHLSVIGSGTGYFNQNPEGLNSDQVAEDPRQPNPDALKYNEYQKTKRATGGLNGTWNLSEAQQFSFSFYARRTGFDESVPSAVQHRQFTSPGGSGLYNLERKQGWLVHHLSIGTDLDGQWVDDHKHKNLENAVEGAVVADQSITQKRFGVFVTERLALGSKWSVLGSVRWDQISNSLVDHRKLDGLDLSGDQRFRRATGRAGLSFNPRSDIGFYTSWGQGFLPPATEELYANPDAIGGFNRNLRPATSWGLEGGARGSIKSRVWYDIAVFHLETQNDFERYRISDRPLETFYANAGDTSRNGIETEIRWVPTSRIRFTGSYTYSHFKYTNYVSNVYAGQIAGNWLPNSPNHQLYFDTSLQLPRSLFVSVGTQALTRAFIDPRNTAYIDGYGLLNARVSKGWQVNKADLKLYVSGRNLTSTKYIAFTEPDPDGNSYQPGPEREVFGGVSVTF